MFFISVQNSSGEFDTSEPGDNFHSFTSVTQICIDCRNYFPPENKKLERNGIYTDRCPDFNINDIPKFAPRRQH